MSKKSRFSPDNTKLTDLEKSLQERADRLVAWLEKQSPEEPIRINQGVSVPNYKKALTTHKNALWNTRVGSPAWKAYANNLAAIKVAIDKQNESKEKKQDAPKNTGSNHEEGASVQEVRKPNRKRR